MILDSCFVIDLLRGDDGAVAKLDELTASSEPLSLPAIVVMEVFYGLESTQAERAFEEATGEMTILPFTGGAARRAARIRKRLDDDGAPIGVLDSMIAATALERGERVLTRNVSHFRRVDGVPVSPY